MGDDLGDEGVKCDGGFGRAGADGEQEGE